MVRPSASWYLAMLLFSCLGLGGCVPPRSGGPARTATVAPGVGCAVTRDTTYEANGHTLDGKRGGRLFVYPAAGRVFKANRPEKLLVFLDPLPATLPAPLIVHGRNRTSGAEAVFENAQHRSDYGTEWGTNYLFPDAGCWELWVGNHGAQDMVVIAVMP
jgi:hypothetical protein